MEPLQGQARRRQAALGPQAFPPAAAVVADVEPQARHVRMRPLGWSCRQTSIRCRQQSERCCWRSSARPTLRRRDGAQPEAPVVVATLLPQLLRQLVVHLHRRLAFTQHQLTLTAAMVAVGLLQLPRLAPLGTRSVGQQCQALAPCQYQRQAEAAAASVLASQCWFLPAVSLAVEAAVMVAALVEVTVMGGSLSVLQAAVRTCLSESSAQVAGRWTSPDPLGLDQLAMLMVAVALQAQGVLGWACHQPHLGCALT